MLQKIKVRLKLSDFINTESESTIMNNLEKINKKYSVACMLYLWFEEDEFKLAELKPFITKWEDKLSFQTKLKTGSELDANDWLFFDIAPLDLNTSKSRFTYKYKFVEQIILGLKQLDNTLDFITKEQPIKPQKRNDYED
tara:strand:- start:13 stop:432 length:420 start_codon:yes stop_codon:yes gene_type:complete